MEKTEIEKKFIIVEDKVAGAGAGTFWSLNGDTDLNRLTDNWKSENLPDEWLLEPVSADLAFSRAVGKLAEGEIFAEYVKTTGEWSLVSKDEIDGLPQYTPIAKWALKGEGALKKPVMTYDIGGEQDNADHPLHQLLMSYYEREKARISTDDVSGWLTRLLHTLRGIRFSAKGRLYYIPPRELEIWNRVRSAVTASTAHEIFNLPMMQSDDAVKTVIAAAKADAQRHIEAYQKFLQDVADGKKIGPDAMATQEAEAEAAKKRLAYYGEFLGQTMPELEDALETLRGSLYAARKQAEQKRDEEKASKKK